jgi:Arc/MetJ family transcription regulator
VHLTKRTTIEIDEALLARAKRALGLKTARATIEEALRVVEQQTQDSGAERISNQQRYLHQLAAHADIAVLASEEMWR